jgi:hypothetical protein
MTVTPPPLPPRRSLTLNDADATSQPYFFSTPPTPPMKNPIAMPASPMK